MAEIRPLVACLLLAGCAAFHSGRTPLGPDRAQASRELMDRGDYLGAARAASALLEKGRLTPSEQQRAYWTLAQSYERLGSLERALSAYQVAVQLFPKNKGLALGMAKLLHRAGLDDRARPLFATVLEMESRNAEAHLGLAEGSLSVGRLDDAIDHYRVALEGSLPDPAATWRDYAHALAERRDFAAAETAIGRALALSPTAENLYARAVFQRAQGKPAAFASLDEALRLESDRRDLRLQRALWLLKDGRLDEAEAEARRMPLRDPLASLILGVSALKRGDRSLAADFFRLASEGTPYVSQAAQALLKDMGGNP